MVDYYGMPWVTPPPPPPWEKLIPEEYILGSFALRNPPTDIYQPSTYVFLVFSSEPMK